MQPPSQECVLEEGRDADGCTMPAAASGGKLTETASGAFDSSVGDVGRTSDETASGAFDSDEMASGAFDSDETASSALESDETAATPSGAFESDKAAAAPSDAFDAGCDVAIGTHATLWPPSQCARWQRAPQ